jgi:myosin-crossreactive antigen
MEDEKILFKNSSKIELEDLKNFSAFVSTKYNKYKYLLKPIC